MRQDRDMRSHLSSAPRWKLALILGGVFASVVTAWSMLVIGDDVMLSLTTGLAGGAVFGTLAARMAVRRRAQWTAAVGDVDRSDLQIVCRAAVRGPAPADPHLREAAKNFAAHIVERRQNERIRDIVIPSAFIILVLVLGASTSAWWFAAVPPVLLLVFMERSNTRTLRRRIALLSSGDHEGLSRPL